MKIIPKNSGSTVLHPMIYRAGKKGKVLFWQGETQDDQYRSRSGQIGGTEKISAWSTAYSMNVGRANMLSADQQAVAVIKSKMDKALKSGGYFFDKTKIGTMQHVIPMTAHKYEKDVTELKFPILVQRKLNGVRCLVSKQGMFSRNGEKIVAAPHIAEALAWVFEKASNANLHLDGELYNHELKEDLQDLMSIVRKQTPSEAQLENSAKMVQFHLYDSFHLGGESEPQETRLKRIETIAKLCNKKSIQLVRTEVIHSGAELHSIYERFLTEGYEGAMLRWWDAPYLHDRSNKLLKYKPRSDSEFEIVEVQEGNGKRKGMAAKIVCKTPKGAKEPTFVANVKWTDARKKEIWLDRAVYPGNMATVSYAYITAYGKPFHNYVEALHVGSKI